MDVPSRAPQRHRAVAIDDEAVLTASDRLAALAAYDLDDPRLRRRLDALAQRTAAELGQPVGLVTLVLDGAQILAGATGVPDWLEKIRGTPVEWSFCANTVVSGEPYLVADAATDPVQRDNPLVTADGVASYAGYPLTTADGHVLGAQCVIGSDPHDFTPADVEVLRAAAAEAVAVLEEHRLPA